MGLGIAPLRKRFAPGMILAAKLHGRMTESQNCDRFAGLDLQQAIDLRWTLRDIRAKRWKFSAINEGHLKTLIEMGLVEMRQDEAILTNAGLNAIA